MTKRVPVFNIVLPTETNETKRHRAMYLKYGKALERIYNNMVVEMDKCARKSYLSGWSDGIKVEKAKKHPYKP